MAKTPGSDAPKDGSAADEAVDRGSPLSVRGKARAAEREARLAEALRRNLRRRKRQAQARDRAEGGDRDS